MPRNAVRGPRILVRHMLFTHRQVDHLIERLLQAFEAAPLPPATEAARIDRCFVLMYVNLQRYCQ